MSGMISGAVNAGVSVREEAVTILNLVRGISFIRNHQVYVGIPQENNSGHDGGLTSAELLYLHTNGSPVNNVPARPTIEPALSKRENAQRIQQMLTASIAKALAGDIGGAESELHKAGMFGASCAQKEFGGGELAPNAPITINGGWMRNKVSGKPVYVKGKGSSAPLIDTGALRQAITYVIRSK